MSFCPEDLQCDTFEGIRACMAQPDFLIHNFPSRTADTTQPYYMDLSLPAMDLPNEIRDRVVEFVLIPLTHAVGRR